MTDSTKDSFTSLLFCIYPLMNTSTNITTLIDNIPLFLDLSPAQRRKISELSTLIELDPGDAPIQEGGPLDLLFIILEGEIQVELFVPTIGQIVTSKLSTYDIIGWSAMTPIVRQRTGTTTALTHCWLIGLNSKLLRSLCEEDHDIGFAIYQRIANVAARSFLTTRIQLMNLLTTQPIHPFEDK